MLQQADDIYISEIKKAGLYRKIAQGTRPQFAHSLLILSPDA